MQNIFKIFTSFRHYQSLIHKHIKVSLNVNNISIDLHTITLNNIHNTLLFSRNYTKYCHFVRYNIITSLIYSHIKTVLLSPIDRFEKNWLFSFENFTKKQRKMIHISMNHFPTLFILMFLRDVAETLPRH